MDMKLVTFQVLMVEEMYLPTSPHGVITQKTNTGIKLDLSLRYLSTD
jgi:hypothetical protein